jgi:hypothetical protein
VPPDRRRSGSATLSGAFELATPIDTDDEDFHDMLYARAEGNDEGDDWDAGVKAQMARNEGKGATGKRGARGGKPNSAGSGTGRRTSGGGGGGDTSPLSSDAETPAPKKGRGSGRTKPAAKRTRESVGDTDEEEVSNPLAVWRSLDKLTLYSAQ